MGTDPLRSPTMPRNRRDIAEDIFSFAQRGEIPKSILVPFLMKRESKASKTAPKKATAPEAEALDQCLHFSFSGRRDYDLITKEVLRYKRALMGSGFRDDEEDEFDQDYLNSGHNDYDLVRKGPYSNDHPAMLRYHVFKGDAELEAKVATLLQARARKADYLLDEKTKKPTHKPVRVTALSRAFASEDEACWAVLQLLQGGLELKAGTHFDGTEYRLAEVRLPQAHLDAEKRRKAIRDAVGEFSRNFLIRTYEVLVLGAPKDKDEYNAWVKSREIPGIVGLHSVTNIISSRSGVPVEDLQRANFTEIHKALREASRAAKAAEAAWKRLKGEYQSHEDMVLVSARKVMEDAPYWAAMGWWGLGGAETLAVAHLEHMITDEELLAGLKAKRYGDD